MTAFAPLICSIGPVVNSYTGEKVWLVVTSMKDSPSLTVNWDSGEGDLALGRRLENAPASLRRDVLLDWQHQIELLLKITEAELHPERAARKARQQRELNTLRRMLCERLSGQVIELAEPLVNGDVLLHLRSGRTVVLYARHEDVKFDVVTDVMHARRYAMKDGTGDYYLREETPEDRLTRSPSVPPSTPN